MFKQSSIGILQARSIPTDFILDTLSNYREEAIALRSVEWDGNSQGTFQLSPYAFSRPGFFSYVTATTATLYLSQLAYVHARLIIWDEQLLPGVTLTDGMFIEARDRDELLMTRLSWRFRSKIPLSSGKIVVRLWTESMRHSGKYLMTKFGFDFHGGAYVGSTTLVMPVEN